MNYFNLDYIKKDFVVGYDTSNLSQKIDNNLSRIKTIDKSHACYGVVNAERNPVDFLACLVAAIELKVPIILCNHDLVKSEWEIISNDFPASLFIGRKPLVNSHKKPVRLDPSSILIPSGGSSFAKPKFVIQDWANLVSESLMVRDFLKGDSLNSVCCLPLYHASGLMQVVRAIATKGKILFTSLGKLEEDLALIDEEKFFLSLVPTQLVKLISNGEVSNKLKKLKGIFLGGAKANQKTLDKSLELKLPIIICYGMSETAGMIAAQRKEEFLKGKFSNGESFMGVDIKINKESLIEIKSPSIFKGYFPSQESHREELFSTNDIGFFDEQGGLIIKQRKDRLINSGGEKIDPMELESLIHASGYVLDAYVTSKESSKWGQEVLAFLVIKDKIKANFEISELIDYLEKKISRYKIPKNFILVDDLPLYDNGKPDREKINNLCGLIT